MVLGDDQVGYLDEETDDAWEETHNGWIRYYQLRKTRFFIGQPCGHQRRAYMNDDCPPYPRGVEEEPFTCVRKPGHGGEHWYIVGNSVPGRWYETNGGNEHHDPAWHMEHRDEWSLPRELLGKRVWATPCHHKEKHEFSFGIGMSGVEVIQDDREFLCVRPKGHPGEHYMVDALNFDNREFCYEPGCGNQTRNQPWKREYDRDKITLPGNVVG